MRIALVTAEHGPAHKDEVDQPLVTALAARDVEVVRPAWDDPAMSWENVDVVVVRTTWDYTSRREEFVSWAKQTGEVTAVWNPPEVLRWNTHKSYLIELEERGTPVVPTAWLGRGDEIDLGALLASRGWGRGVVKPAVGARGEGVVRVDGDDEAGLRTAKEAMDRLLTTGDVLVQPYLESVETRGELSVVVIDGVPSHALRRMPAPGEYRVHRGDGHDVREELDRDVAGLAAWIVDATGTELLHARVDLLEDDLGAPQLSELELTEPDLFLTAVPQAAETFADAILRRASG